MYCTRAVRSRTTTDFCGCNRSNCTCCYQESTFKPNVCEGGTIIPYDRCLDGGYGLIQWTSKHRYDGLGTFCAKRKADPSSLECQTAYMIHELRFRDDLSSFLTNHQTVPYYMNAVFFFK
jgi:hypothetical protein